MLPGLTSLEGKYRRGIAVRLNFSHVGILATTHGEIDARLDRICIIGTGILEADDEREGISLLYPDRIS